jgi:hypothetical protein
MYSSAYRKYLFSAIIICILSFIYAYDANAQYYNTGQEPASIRWKQIKTTHFKLVFPDYYEENARKLAGYLDTVYKYASATLDHHPKRIPLWLHTQSATSNALVAWAPKRMEFYTTPGQDMYAQPWLEQLSIHEYRHVVQVDKLNQGFTKVLSWIFGQQGTAAVLGLYVPSWFMEGDAVVTETGLSYSGRGRQPLFEMKMRAIALEKGPYTYDKASMGSYRDFLPNQYELGYFLVAEGRRKYGPEIWEHSLNRIARRPYMVTPFQKGIKDISGKKKLPFYDECMSSLQAAWQKQDDVTLIANSQQLSPPSRIYTNYSFPLFINDSTVLAIKSALEELTLFVSIGPEGKEEVIFKPGFLKKESLSYAAGQICWVETRPDLRWSNRSTTIIRIYDIESGKARTINKKMRLFAPALSKDASRIVTVRVDSMDQYSLVVLDANDGSILNVIPAPANAFPMTPVWANENMILAVLVSEDGKNIAKFDVASGRSKTLLQWDYTDISRPVYHAPYIFFTAAWSGISNIYALDITEGGIYKVSSSRFGADYACVSEDGSRLVFADYSSDGYRVVTQDINNKEWLALNDISDQGIGLYRSIAAQEEVVPPWSDVPASEAPSKKYSKIGNLFNFHSWAPLDINASNYTIQPGISIMSQNLLSSSFLEAGYSYNLNEEAGKVYGNYSYRGWYPIFDLYADYGLRRKIDYQTEANEVSWDETNLRAGVRLPLNLRRGRYYAGIEPAAYVNQGLRRMKKGSPVDSAKSDIFSTGYSLNLYRQRMSTFRDIYPKWGQSVGLYYRDTPLDQDNMSYILAGIGNFYFPGLFRHHGINIYSGYQYRIISSFSKYKFTDLVSYPRGVNRMQDQELLSFRATYALPIAYPDWSIGPVLYMKRIRAGLFYDYAIGLNPKGKNYYQSTGIDLITEVHILRFVAPIELGLRSIYLPDENAFTFGFLFGIGFDSFYVGQD